jgi:protein-tyrosine kinase
MGKIHKALEKSKKDRQQAQKGPIGSFNIHPENKRRSIDVMEKKQDRIESRPAADSELSTIHALLGDTVQAKPIESDASPSKEEVQSLEREKIDGRIRKTEITDEIQQKRFAGGGEVDNNKNKYEPSPRSKKEEGDGLNDEALAEAASREPQDVVAQKIVSLKSTKKLDRTVSYFKDDDYATQSDESESFPPRVETGESLKYHYSLVTLAKPKSFEAEQFKILRANLLFPKSGKPPQTILLTSAVPGEGKTFTAMNLAVSLAQNLNSHVLLVDADIRKPEIHKRFGLRDNLKGLSDFLTQNLPIASLLVKTPLSNLTILPGGQAAINPSELISSEKMKKLLDELSTRYSDRFVIIDAPPPKLAAETYALARFVEHIIPVVRSGRSNRELVEEMMELLGRDKIQGVVLNCYEIRGKKRFGYHKYSEYYSK